DRCVVAGFAVEPADPPAVWAERRRGRASDRPGHGMSRGRLPYSRLPSATITHHARAQRHKPVLAQLRVAGELDAIVALGLADATAPGRAPTDSNGRLPALHAQADVGGVGSARLACRGRARLQRALAA